MTHSSSTPSGSDAGNSGAEVGYGTDESFSQPAYYASSATPGAYQQPGVAGYPSGASATDSSSGGAAQKAKDTAATAKDQAANVGQGAAQAGQQVAGVAKEQAANVASEAAGQAKDLIHQGRTELSTQAATQQQRLAAGVRALGEELHSMGTSSDKPGPASDLVRQAADRTQLIAGWLENREPAQVVAEVQHFARQRPGAFLLLAAGLGLAGGRMTRGLVAAKQDESHAAIPAPAPYSTPAAGYTPPVPGYSQSPGYGTPTYGDSEPGSLVIDQPATDAGQYYGKQAK